MQDPGTVAIDTNATTVTETETATATAEDLGLLLEAEGSVTASTTGVGSVAIQISLTDVPGTCSAGTFTLARVGDAKVIETGTFADKAFKVQGVPVKEEGIATFTCDGGVSQRCFVKAGDKGVLCNAVADRVINAFETAIGKSIEDASFRNKSVAKVAAAIVDAATIDSDEVQAFRDGLAACDAGAAASKKSCYHDVILASPFNASFKLMQQLVGTWTAEGLVMFVTDVLGLQIQVEDDLYSTMIGGLDKALGVTFVADLRKLIKDVVVAQVAQTSDYAFAVRCAVTVNGDQKTFDPDLAGNVVKCNEGQAEEIFKSFGIADSDIAQVLHPATGTRPDGEYPCTVNPNPQGKCWVDRPSVFILSRNSEPDRNDVEGTRRRFDNGPNRVHLIDVMPRVEKEIQKAGIPMAKEGGPVIDPNDAATMKKLYTAVGKSKDHFLGLIGIYRFFNSPDLAASKLSLNQIYEIFTGDRFRRARISAWGPGISGRQYTDGSYNAFLPPLLHFDDGANAYRFNSIFKFNPGQMPGAIDKTAAEAAVAAAKPSFADSLGMFTKIPDSTEISAFVFNGSTHEEWNPAGSHYLQVAMFQNSNKPINCRLESPGAGLQLQKTSKVVCDTNYADVTCTEGDCTIPSTHGPFVLFERGWFGDDIGRTFALGSRLNGREVGLGRGQPALVKEFKAGNPAGKCDATQKGKVIEYLDEIWCGAEKKCQQQVTAYCADLSAVANPARVRFYQGGLYTVANIDPKTGQRREWQVPLIGIHDNAAADHRGDAGACLFVPSGTFTTPGSNFASSGVLSGVANLTSVTYSVKKCAVAANVGGVKYPLFQFKDFDDANNAYAFALDPSSGATLQFKLKPDSGEPWEDTYMRVNLSTINGGLSGGLSVIGTAATQINSMSFANPIHDAKFDPYCDDVNGNGACDCFAATKLSDDNKPLQFASTVRADPSQCGLLDKAAEPTLSELPYCANCDNSQGVDDFFTAFGGKSGDALNSMQAFINGHPNLQLNFGGIAVCAHKDDQGRTRSPQRVNWGHWGESTHKGCPAVASGTASDTTQGPIRIMSIQPMRNAFTIGRPNGIIKLINYATKSIGQGRAIDPDDKVFSPDEALALMALRMQLPPTDLKIKDAQGKTIKNVSPVFQAVQKIGGGGNDPVSTGLKGIMFQLGRFTSAEIDEAAARGH